MQLHILKRSRKIVVLSRIYIRIDKDSKEYLAVAIVNALIRDSSRHIFLPVSDFGHKRQANVKLLTMLFKAQAFLIQAQPNLTFYI